jgi:hypothetical protein
MAKELNFEIDCGEKKLKIRMEKWSPTKVYKKLPVIGNYFAVPFSMVFQKDSDGFSTDGIPQALLLLFQTMEEDDFNTFLKMLVEGSFCGQKNVAENIDDIFEDDPSALLELATLILEEHYACFFKRGFGRMMGVLGPITQQAKALEK